MKKIGSFIYFILFTGSLFSQININNGDFTGINGLNLGDDVGQFGASITRIDSSVWKGKLSTTYVCLPAGNSHELAAIRFQSCLLSFDQQHKLEWMQLVRLRLKQDSSLSSKKLDREIEKLVDYTNEITGIKTKKKLQGRYQSIRSYIYKWTGAKTVIQLDVSYKANYNLGYSFIIRWKTPEDQVSASSVFYDPQR